MGGVKRAILREGQIAVGDKRHKRWFAVLGGLVVVFTIPAPALSLPPDVQRLALVQGDSRTFPETGKTVRGRFLQQWNAQGGLAQHGYPIADEMDELSDIDGKLYTVQYFERSVFELHPTHEPPYDVLLQLLGTLAYKERYPNGAPGQQPSSDPATETFLQMGKRLGGRFLTYWKETGGLMRHGYPISDEFEEVSALNGKSYRVQYFERSVFELHPENTAPYDVLLSQLGTLALERRVTASNPLAPPNEWKLWDPMDPTAPELIVPGEKGYRLRQDWEVARIDYLFRPSGVYSQNLNGRQSIYGHSQVEKHGDGYKRDGAPVPSEWVQAFVRSLEHLQATPGLAWATTGALHADRYWGIEIVGTDGNHVLVTSQSYANEGTGVPWNVYYNGRMYAQFDGSMIEPLFRLFPYQYWRPQPHGSSVRFTTALEYPHQIRYGFWGMFPFSDEFEYTADAAQQTITGRFAYSLRSLTLTGDGKSIPCDVKNWSPSVPYGDMIFTCPIENVRIGQSYRYQTELHVSVYPNGEIIATGELWGVWGVKRDQIITPIALDLRETFRRNTELNDLLSDHGLLDVRYSGSVRTDDPTAGERNGTILFAGKTSLYGKPERYTIGTRFRVLDGEFKYWILNRTTLRRLLSDVAALPLTRRMLRVDPNLEINLWYATDPLPIQRAGTVDSYQVRVNACGNIPGGIFPSETQPLLAFNYSDGNYRYLYDGDRQAPYQGFVLINGKPVVSALELGPGWDPDLIKKALLPKEFDTGNARPFDKVWIRTHPLFVPTNLVPGQIELYLQTPDNPTAEEQAIYHRIADSLPGTTLPKPDSYCYSDGSCDWEKRGLTFAVQENGELSVVGCQP